MRAASEQGRVVSDLAGFGHCVHAGSDSSGHRDSNEKVERYTATLLEIESAASCLFYEADRRHAMSVARCKKSGSPRGLKHSYPHIHSGMISGILCGAPACAAPGIYLPFATVLGSGLARLSGAVHIASRLRQVADSD